MQRTNYSGTSVLGDHVTLGVENDETRQLPDLITTVNVCLALLS